jgi:hypothetical protein
VNKKAKIINVYFENGVKISVYESVSISFRRTPIRVNEIEDDLFEISYKKSSFKI